MTLNEVTISLGRLERSYPHCHQGIEFLLLIKGSVTMTIDNDDVVLQTDDLVLINSKQFHHVKEASDNVALLLKIGSGFLYEQGATLCQFNCNSSSSNFEEMPIYFESKRILVRMMLCYWRKENGYTLEFQSLLFKLLYQLQVHFSTAEVVQSVVKENDIHDVLSYISDHFREPLTLQELAKLLFMTPTYFSKVFKEKIGIGFLDYLMKIRLEHAVSDLLTSDDSMIKIALNNGFASAKSFNRTFYKEYEMLPSDYRKKHFKPMSNKQELAEFELQDGDRQELLRYIRQYKLIEEQSEWGGKTVVSMNRDVLYTIKPSKNLLHIGSLDQLSSFDVVEQLREARENTDVVFIYCTYYLESVHNEIQQAPFFDHYEHYRLFSQVERVGMPLFWHIDMAVIQHRLDDFLQQFTTLIQQLVDRNIAISEWRIEVGCSDPSLLHQYQWLYQRISLIVSPFCYVGMHIDMEHRSAELQALPTMLQTMKKHHCRVDFVSVCGNQQMETKYEGISPEALEQLKNYHYQLVSDVKGLMELGGYGDGELYMPTWNALTGKEFIQSGTFFRSALILDTMLSCQRQVDGFGFNISTYTHSVAHQQMDTSDLSLFLYFKAKRPIYFVLTMMKRLAPNVIYQDTHLLVSKHSQDYFTVLVYYPCYVDPLYSVDDAYVAHISKRLSIVLTGLIQGNYRIKRFTLDRDQGGIFKWWEKAGSFDYKDDDIEEYMNSLLHGFYTYNETVEVEMELKPEVSFNGIVFYTIKKQ